MAQVENTGETFRGSLVRSYAFPLLIGLAVAGSVLALLRWMATEVFEGETDAFDQAVRSGIHSIASPAATNFFIGVSFIGSPAFLVGLGVVIVGSLIYFGRKSDALLFVITMAGEIILDVGLKGIYMRARPEPFFEYAVPASFSFPSGHALGSLCFYGIAGWLMWTRTKSTPLRWMAPFALAVLIVLVGISRIYLGVHYPTDVLAGFAAGTVWTTTVCLADTYFRPRRDSN